MDTSPSAAVMWDPDAAGPLPPRLVVGGQFEIAGATRAKHVAMWDGNSWQPLGDGSVSPVPPYHHVGSLAVLPNGDLVAGGNYNQGSPLAIMRFDGASWAPLGEPFATPSTPTGSVGIYDMAVLTNGDLIAVGTFEVAGTTPLRGVARWDGVAWQPVGGGLTSHTGGAGTGACVLPLPDGGFVVGGNFTSAGGVAASCLARWDGSTWHALGGQTNHYVWDLALLPEGTIVAGGQFTTIGGANANRIATWDGTSWTQLADGLNREVFDLEVLHDGRLAVGGRFSGPTGPQTHGLAVWDGSAWSSVDSGLGHCSGPATGYSHVDPSVNFVLEPQPGTLFVGGRFTRVNHQPADYIARFDGEHLVPLGAGTNNGMADYTHDAEGRLIAVGTFWTVAGVPARGIARWDGVAWSQVGGGIPGDVAAVVTMPNGDIIAGGAFSSAGGVPANNIARFDGTAWHPLAGGLLGAATGYMVRSLEVLPNGDLVAFGGFTSANGVPAPGIARWDGVLWHPMPAPGFGVLGTIVRRNGTLVCGGWGGLFYPTLVARWTGTNWQQMGNTFFTGGFPEDYWPVRGFAESPAGELFAYGSFITGGTPQAFGLAKWDGLQWQGVGLGYMSSVYAMDFLAHSGDPVISGSIRDTPGIPPNIGFARGQAGAWTPFPEWDSWAPSIRTLPSGELVAHSYRPGAGLSTIHFNRFTETNIPWVALHPTPFTTTPTLPVTLSATPATGYDNLTFQWQRETAPGSNQWLNLADGPSGASPNGGTVTGATGTINGGEPALCTIINLQLSDAGNYRCVISNPCGQDESNPALLSISNPCQPDLTTTALPGTPNYGTPNATLNNDDFFYYLQQFVAGNLAVADLTTTSIPGTPGYGVPNGAITDDDFFYYLLLFVNGC